MQKDKMTYEKASEKLDELLEKMSCEDVALEDSIKYYAQAAELIIFCNSTLEKAQIKVEEISAQLQKDNG